MCATLFIGCTEEQVRIEKDVIIVIPGLQGSVLYDAEHDVLGWAAEDLDDIAAMEKGFRYEAMNFTEDGEPANIYSATLKPITFDTDIEKWKYGVNLENFARAAGSLLGLTPTVVKGLAQSIESAYENTNQEVIVYQYDWRRSNVVEAEKLEKFINDNGYTDVKFVVHSMGGILVSQYLARSAENINKCSLLISLGTPYFGSIELTKYMETLKLPGSEVLTVEFGINYPSAFELLPSAVFNSTSHFTEGQTSLIVDGAYKSYEDAMIYYSTNTSWGLKEDGTPKPMFNALTEFHNSMFTEDGKHITSLVNTYYLQGSGRDTTVSINYTDGKYDANGNKVQPLGDGIVPLYSGICGLSEDAENVIIIMDDPTLPNNEGYVGHMGFPSQPRTIEAVLRILATVEEPNKA
jgi:hypothetical protein